MDEALRMYAVLFSALVTIAWLITRKLPKPTASNPTAPLEPEAHRGEPHKES